jgi:CubicO group peptidase (beta-lactamase class C family)
MDTTSPERSLAVLAACLLLASSTSGPVCAAPDAAREAVESFRRAAGFGFSGAVAIDSRGRVLDGAYGVADRRRGTAVEGDTLFAIGSVTKMFTAATVLRLAERRDLALTDPIGKWLPDAPADKRAISVEQLLAHTSGIDFHFGRDLSIRTRDEVVATILAAPLAFPPGSSYAYSDGGYTVLAAIAETVAGLGFHDLVRAEVLRPAGLSRTAFLGEERPPGPVARSYADDADLGSLADWPAASWVFRGNGDMVSTARDLARFGRALVGGTLLAPTSWARMRSANGPEGSYGLGIELFRDDSGAIVAEGHSGEMFGYSSVLLWLPDGIVAAAVSNQRPDLLPTATRLTRRFLLDHRVPPEFAPCSARQSTRVTGTYGLPGGGRLVLTRHREGLRLHAEGQAALDALGLGVADAAASNRATARVIDAMRDNNYAALHDLLPVGARPERWAAGFLEQWQMLSTGKGEVRSVDLLGTAPAGVPKGFLEIGVLARGSSTVLRLDGPSGPLLATR